MKISLIIPAAGLSSRHKENKLLRKIDEKFVLEKTISTFTSFPIQILVVLGFQSKIIRKILENEFAEQIEILENKDFRSGKSSSIRAGISACEDADYLGFCNGDLPFISKETVTKLLNILKMKKPSILAPKFQNQMGHPIFFNRKLRSELLHISGDFGGISVVNAHPETVFVPVDDSGVIIDMDRLLENEKI
ncbi:MAG: nucleotidyltransferase family protein [Candidatus Marinimicrobia bacterium]|nr:nucleotidyltransferase family protein [Candidatus Neomarinimicrobiota bacterium]